LFTPTVEIENEPTFWPADIVTEPGTVAAELLLVKLTTVPPVAAGPLRVTVPVEAPPPRTELGLKLSDTNAVEVIVKVAD